MTDWLWKSALAVAPGGVHSPVRAFHAVGGEPVFFKKAKGARLWDLQDKDYIDFCMGFGPLILGHSPPELVAILSSVLEEGAWPLGACEPYSLALAQWLCREIPWIEKIRFVSSGTEAVMSAVRLARAYTGRKGLLKFEGSYHGHVDSLLVKAGSGLAGSSAMDSAGIGSCAQDTYILPLHDEQALEDFFARKGRELALVLIEPLPANYGLLIQAESFWWKLSRLAREYGALVLFDEVISAFRVGLQGMAGILGIQPDILCLGKIIGGGFPIGAYGAKKELMDMVAPSGPVYQAGTLSAHPLAMQAGLAVLKRCKKDNIYQDLGQKTKYFCSRLEGLLSKAEPEAWEIIQYASLFWIKSSGKQAPHKQNYASLFHKFLRASIYLPPSAYEVAFLSAAHTKALLDEALCKIEDALKS